MANQNKSILRKLLSTESEWNPKVMIGRVAVRVLPESLLHRFKKSYYAFLIKHTAEDWVERDAFIAKHLISPGDSVLDIGANIGQYSRFCRAVSARQGTYMPSNRFLRPLSF